MAKARNEEKAGTQQDWPMAHSGAARQRSERYIKETAKGPAESMRGTPRHDWPIAAESADRKKKICMVRRLAFPAPPTSPPNGMVWYGVGGGGGGRGAGVCGEGWGPLELQLEKRPGVTDKASIVHKPYASHKSYNEEQ